MTKRLKLFDCVLAVVCVVLTAESAAPVAIIGNSQFFWWILMLICFVVPYAMISAELGTTYPSEGGLYDWVSRAYGKRWGNRVAWYYWINFPLWIAAFAVFLTDNLPPLLGLHLSTGWMLALRVIWIWSVLGLSMLRIDQSKWLINIATVMKVCIIALLGIAGIVVVVTRGAANPLTLRSFLPGENLRSLSYVSVILFNFMGFEVVTTFVDSMQDPQRQIPKATIWGGAVVTLLYLLASFGVGVAIPIDQISPSMGILDSIKLLLNSPSGLLISGIGLALMFVMFIMQLSWAYGVHNVTRYSAVDSLGLPRIFARSTKSGAPIGAALMTGCTATVLVVIAPFIPSDQLFWSFFALNVVAFMASYLPFFPAFLKLRKIDASADRPFRVKGGPRLLWLMAYVPMALVVITLLFTVVPLDRSELADKIPLAIGSLLAILAGEIIAARVGKTKSH